MESHAENSFKLLLETVASHFDENVYWFLWREICFCSEISIYHEYTGRSMEAASGGHLYGYERLDPDLEDKHHMSPLAEQYDLTIIAKLINDVEARPGQWLDLAVSPGQTTEDQIADILDGLAEIACPVYERIALFDAFNAKRDEISVRLRQKPYFGVPTLPNGSIRVLGSGVLAVFGSCGPTIMDIPSGLTVASPSSWLWSQMAPRGR